MSETEIETEGIFYDTTPCLSYGAVINLISGARGGGKTFGYKKFCVKDAMRGGGKFVWVRRYEKEMKKCKKTFLQDLVGEGVINADEWKVKGNNVLYQGDVVGTFIVLSTSLQEKSGNFREVDKIVFDEALLKPHSTSRYLTDEVEVFLELYETVNRLRLDGRKDCRCFIIGNKTSYVNPWFSYFSVLPFEGRFKWAKKGLVLVEDYKNEKFKELKKQTKMGKVIDGTTYGNYVMDNESWFDDDAFIGKRTKDFNACMNVVYKGNMMGIWKSDRGLLYIGEECKGINVFAGSSSDLKETNSMFRWYERLTYAYENGCILFKDTVVKGHIIDMLQRYGRLRL